MVWNALAGVLRELSATTQKGPGVGRGLFDCLPKSSEDEDQDEDYQNEGSYSDVHSCSFLIKSG